MGIDFTVVGQYSNYNGNGYNFQVGNQTDKTTDVWEKAGEMAGSDFISDQTVGLTFLLGGYIISEDLFFVVSLSLEQNGSGGWNCIQSMVEIFLPSFFWLNWSNWIVELLQLCCTIMIGLVLFFYLRKQYKKKQVYKKLLKTTVFMEMFILVL